MATGTTVIAADCGSRTAREAESSGVVNGKHLFSHEI